MIRIERCISSLINTNMYIIVCNNHALILDPQPNIEGNELVDCILDGIILTHEHYDHICGVHIWKEKYNCPVYAGQDAAKGLMDSRINLSHYGRSIYEIMFPDYKFDKEIIADYTCHADKFLNDEDIINWQGNTLRIMFTPGHTAGSICILLNNECLFCGDTLMGDLTERVRWKTGSMKAFLEITQPKLKSLDGNVTAYPGHGEPFKLKNCEEWLR